MRLPHDALRDTDRTPDAPGKGAGAYYPQAGFTYLKTFTVPEEWRGRLEARLGEAVSFFVNTYGSELAEVISVTVDRWDGKEAAERIELHVGRDLQFIRINGTIVGALAGLLIHTLAQLVLQLT